MALLFSDVRSLSMRCSPEEQTEETIIQQLLIAEMSVINCSAFSVEVWHYFYNNAVKFVKLYKAIIDAYVSNYFVEDHCSKLPNQWKVVLGDMDTEELSGLLSAEPKHRRVLPLSLLCFKCCTQTYSISRQPVDLTTHSIQKLFTDSLHTELVDNASFPIKPEVPDAPSSKDKIKDGQFLPLNHRFRKHVKPKKQHEILQLGKMISLVCGASGCRHVVDVGAGQGHLSRLLTFGHGLKVTTVEASGCHAPKAEKFDKDMSYSIRSQLKRKFEGQQSDYCEDIRNVDRLPLPNHVTCMIQPNTTPSEFLNVIHSQTKQTNEEVNLCTCSRQITSEAGNNLSEEICQDCLKPRSCSNKDKSLVLTGLHACGDLIPTILRVFSKCSDIKGLVSVGCCYMKMTTKQSSTIDIGYPMSNYVAGLPDHQLSYQAREHACHSIDVYRQRLVDNPPNLKLHCYRALLQEIIIHKQPDFVFGTTKLTIKKAEQMEFENYAKLALDRLGLDTYIGDEILKTVQFKLSKWKDVVAFYTIRLALAPVVETLILLDRMFYLQEQGVSSYLIPVFDPSLSPRNLALVAYK